MISGVQVLGLLFAFGLLYLSFLSFKRNEFTPTEWTFWTILAIGVGLMSLFPQFLDPIVARFQFARALDLYVIVGFMFLISALFYTYTISRKTQRRVEELVRSLALHEAGKRKGRK